MQGKFTTTVGGRLWTRRVQAKRLAYGLSWSRGCKARESVFMLVETILIVEDNADIRELLTCLLQAEGYNVIAAEDCAGGLDQLREQGPDLVIADVMLPDYSGLQFIRWGCQRAGPRVRVGVS